MDQITLANSLGFPTPLELQEVYRDWVPDPAKFIGLGLLPMKDWPNEIPRWDKRWAAAGLTHGITPQGMPDLVASRGAQTQLAQMAHWGEEKVYNASDFIRMRELGTVNKHAGEEQVMSDLEELDIRLWSRLESIAWSVLTTGTVSINDGLVGPISLDYGIPAANKVTMGSTSGYGPMWNDVDNATPIEDIQLASELFLGVTDELPDLYVNFYDVKFLAQNNLFRDLIKQSPLAVNVGRESLKKVFPSLVGNLNSVTMYNGGYISSIDSTTGYGTFTPFIPKGTAVLVAPPPRNQPLGYTYTAPDPRNGGMINAKPGKWLVIEDESMKIKCQYRMATGITSIPGLNFERCIVIMTTYS